MSCVNHYSLVSLTSLAFWLPSVFSHLFLYSLIYTLFLLCFLSSACSLLLAQPSLSPFTSQLSHRSGECMRLERSFMRDADHFNLFFSSAYFNFGGFIYFYTVLDVFTNPSMSLFWILSKVYFVLIPGSIDFVLLYFVHCTFHRKVQVPSVLPAHKLA